MGCRSKLEASHPLERQREAARVRLGAEFPGRGLAQPALPCRYAGTGKAWIERELGWAVELAKHTPNARGEWLALGTGDDPQSFEWRRLPPERTGFRCVVSRRWAAERTFSWLCQSRRSSKEYERLCETSEAMIYATMTRLMARRLARI